MSDFIPSVLTRAGLVQDNPLSSIVADCLQNLDLSEERGKLDAIKRLETVVEDAVSALLTVQDWGAAANGAVDTNALVKEQNEPLNRQVFIYQFLSEGEPLDCYTLAGVDYETSEGRCVGSFVTGFDRSETVETMAEALVSLGSDPEFFMLYGDDD